MTNFFQAGTINTLAALGKLVIQSSERILLRLTFFFSSAGGHTHLFGNHYWLCCVGDAHVSKCKFRNYISTPVINGTWVRSDRCNVGVTLDNCSIVMGENLKKHWESEVKNSKKLLSEL